MLVIFYLGFGCLHCVEQLEAFAPKNSGFNELGIEILAVATDSKEEVKEALATYSEGHEKFPFKIVSNPELDVFKKYRAHDDFEGKALHGTYLIDGEGKIRWQDIGYEPFTNIDFLLKECERLLKQ